MIKDYKPTSLESKEAYFEKVPWINEQSIDDRLLKNKWEWYFTFDFQGTSGASGDATSRVVSLIGANGNMRVSYTASLLAWLWSITGLLSRTGTLFVQGDSFILPAWKVLEGFWYFSATWQQVEVRLTGSQYRYLRWSTNILTNTNNNFSVLNTGWADIVVDFRFATSSANIPNFGVLIKIF